MKKLLLIITFLILASVSYGQSKVYVHYSFTDTVTNVADTLSRKIASANNTVYGTTFNNGYRMTVYAKDSTIQISPLPSFPANQTIEIVAGASWNSPERYAASDFTNWYIRKKSTHAGVCNYILIVEGE